MGFVDDVVGQWMARAEKSGEMRAAAGKPLLFDEAFEQTPEELRLTHKILKNAGYVPAEVEMLRSVADLRHAADKEPDVARRQALQQRIAELESGIRIRLEHLRRS